MSSVDHNASLPQNPLDPRPDQVCAMCGLDRRNVSLLVEGQAGFVCSTCAPTIVATCAGHGGKRHATYLAQPILEVLAFFDPKTPWADVEPLLEGAGALVAADEQQLARVALEAFRFHHYTAAMRVLDRVPPHSRSAWVRLHRVFACLALENRTQLAIELASLQAISMTPTERQLAEIHRGWAAFRLETRGEPRFGMDPERLLHVVGELRSTGPKLLQARSLEVLAAFERTRNRAVAEAHLDEAIALMELPSNLLLRGDLAAARGDLVRARVDWERALAVAHPEGVWAARASARLRAVA